MSLGLGILLSAILFIAAWQVDKRNAWRKAGKIFLWSVLLMVIAGAMAYVYFGWWSDVKSRRGHDAEVARIRDPNGLAYWDIKLGMSKDEVRYLKGAPTKTRPAVNGDSSEEWVYIQGESPHSHQYEINWDVTGMHVKTVACEGTDSFECERIAGVGSGMSEADPSDAR